MLALTAAELKNPEPLAIGKTIDEYPQRVIAMAALTGGRMALVPTIPEDSLVRNFGYHFSHQNPDLVERRLATPNGCRLYRRVAPGIS